MGAYQGKVRGGSFNSHAGDARIWVEGRRIHRAIPFYPFINCRGKGKAGWICFLSVFYFWYDKVMVWVGVGVGRCYGMLNCDAGQVAGGWCTCG